ncbi:hypothetical protein TKK_0002930 [Trichogramma kaykai]
MVDGELSDNHDVCRCYKPDQTGLSQGEARAESLLTNATGGTVDNAAHTMEDLPIVSQPSATSPSGEPTATWANAQKDCPLGFNETVKEKPSFMPQARTNAQSGEATLGRREQACADIRAELRKLEEESREQKDEARRLIRARKKAAEEAKKL